MVLVELLPSACTLVYAGETWNHDVSKVSAGIRAHLAQGISLVSLVHVPLPVGPVHAISIPKRYRFLKSSAMVHPKDDRVGRSKLTSSIPEGDHMVCWESWLDRGRGPSRLVDRCRFPRRWRELQKTVGRSLSLPFFEQPPSKPRSRTPRTATLVKRPRQAEPRPAGNSAHRGSTRRAPLGTDRLARPQQHLRDQGPSASRNEPGPRGVPRLSRRRRALQERGKEAVRSPAGAHEQNQA